MRRRRNQGSLMEDVRSLLGTRQGWNHRLHAYTRLQVGEGEPWGYQQLAEHPFFSAPPDVVPLRAGLQGYAALKTEMETEWPELCAVWALGEELPVVLQSLAQLEQQGWLPLYDSPRGQHWHPGSRELLTARETGEGTALFGNLRQLLQLQEPDADHPHGQVGLQPGADLSPLGRWDEVQYTYTHGRARARAALEEYRDRLLRVEQGLRRAHAALQAECDAAAGARRG